MPSEVIGSMCLKVTYMPRIATAVNAALIFTNDFLVLLYRCTERLVMEFYSMGSVLAVNNRRRWIILT